MNELLPDLLRESISLGILVFVLFKGYGLLDRLLTLADLHLTQMETKLDLLLELMAQMRDQLDD